jgi:hypothetical protein
MAGLLVATLTLLSTGVIGYVASLLGVPTDDIGSGAEAATTSPDDRAYDACHRR